MFIIKHIFSTKPSPTTDNTELLSAIYNQDVEEVRRILKSRKCDVNKSLSWKDPPVVECVGDRQGSQNDVKLCAILRLLVRYGAELDVCGRIPGWFGMTPAMLAAQQGFLECLLVLVDSGADLGVATHEGETALMFAAREGNCDCVRFLTRRGSRDILDRQNTQGKTALMIAASLKEKCHLLCMQRLLDAGAQVNVRDSDGFTALMLALQANVTGAVKLLLDNGALINTTHQTPETYLLSSFCKDVRVAMKLLSLGLNPTLSGYDKGCLHKAIQMKQKRAVRALVVNGFPSIDKIQQAFNPSHRVLYLSHRQRSPLAVAILSLQPDIAKYLIVNSFFTPYDIQYLSLDQGILDILHCGSTRNERARAQCLGILRFLSANPQSLRTLSLVAISSALSQDLLKLPQTTQGQTRWMFKPTYGERVETLTIPPALKRALLHQTPSAAICCDSWGDISLEQANCFAECHCKGCEGE